MPGTFAMPLVAPLKYDLPLARTCSFLVNVGSDMGDQFVAWRKLHPLEPAEIFTSVWKPADKCAITSRDHSVNSYKIGNLTYGTITDKVSTRTEPFAFSAVPQTDASMAFLVFRGTKTTEDLQVDADHSQVNYILSSGKPSGLVDKGFFDLFKTMERSLSSVMKTLFTPSTRRLVITGHSLGSALATLTVPLAVRMTGGLDVKVHHYNQASPRVGDPAFAAFLNSLEAPTFRLVNIEDVVPTLPGPESKTEGGTVYYYQHVGSQASFSAQYLGVPKNHDPCCAYSYALYNPEGPFNPIPGDCFPPD